MTEKKHNYGGQAVIEGVMIRGKRMMSTAVRRSDGEIVVDTQPLPSIYTGRLRALPLTRGIVVLIEALVLGMKTLMYSANISLEEEGEKIEGPLMWVTMAVAMLIGVAVFFLVPMFLTKLFTIGNTVLFHLVEGLIRMAIFILYLRLISFMPDIKRVFAYHGAEHKVVNAHEAGATLEVEAVSGYSTAHVRCGSSFLFVVLILAIIVFALIGLPSVWIMVLSRLALIPVISALGYEVIYFGSRHTENPLVRAVLAPGLWLQALTTRPPDEQQIEVALLALSTAIEADQQSEEALPNPA
ncbi:MAG TPA: DUF1385 domain-containing protein [Dehalococcoidales bacterium]|nr:DUF1385 domain-containing protein [Dehalococcoidales bacterium]